MTKDEIIEIDRKITEYKKREMEGKCMVIKYYYISLAIAYLLFALMIIYEDI